MLKEGQLSIGSRLQRARPQPDRLEGSLEELGDLGGLVEDHRVRQLALRARFASS